MRRLEALRTRIVQRCAHEQNRLCRQSGGFIPDAIAEMEGIAAGANVSFAEIVLLNVRTELTLGDAGLRDGCSSLGFLTSPDGQ